MLLNQFWSDIITSLNPVIRSIVSNLHISYLNDSGSCLCSPDIISSFLVANSATGPKDVAIGADASLSYRYRESHRNEELLQLWSQGRAKRQISSSDSRLSLSFRTGKNAVLMRTEPSLEATTLQVKVMSYQFVS